MEEKAGLSSDSAPDLIFQTFLREGGDDLLPGGRAGIGGPFPALAAERPDTDRPVRIPVEQDAHVVQPFQIFRRFPAEGENILLRFQKTASLQGILCVQGGGVVPSRTGRVDAACRHDGLGPLRREGSRKKDLLPERSGLNSCRQT